MVYKSFLPGPVLSELVRNYTIIHFQFDSKVPGPIKQRSPKAEQKIVFYIKGFITLVNPATGTIQSPPKVSVFSHQKEIKAFLTTPEFFAFIIFLQPGALHRMIGLPMLDLVQEYFDAELFFGTEVRLVNEQLAAAANHLSMITIAEKFLLSHCKLLQVKNPVDVIATNILADPTLFSMDTAAQRACLSTKQFYRKFTERIGITPKSFSRLSRFNHAYRYKIAHPEATWSSIAQEFYYTDYHHLEKEFKYFTGLTPKDWVTTDLKAPERILKLR